MRAACFANSRTSWRCWYARAAATRRRPGSRSLGTDSRLRAACPATAAPRGPRGRPARSSGPESLRAPAAGRAHRRRCTPPRATAARPDRAGASRGDGPTAWKASRCVPSASFPCSLRCRAEKKQQATGPVLCPSAGTARIYQCGARAGGSRITRILCDPRRFRKDLFY